MAIKCCFGCVAPKRYPGCHGTCNEYLTEKAEHDRIKAEHDLKRIADSALYGNRANKVYVAMKDRRNK